jgi:thermitase
MQELKWRLSLVGIASCLVWMFYVGASLGLAQTHALSQPSFAPDRVLVSFQPGTAASDIGASHRQAGGRVIKTLSRIGVQVVAVPHGTVLSAIKTYQRNPNVVFAEPNYRRSLFLPATNEGSEPSLGIANNFTEQWGLHNTGQSFGAVLDPLTFELIAPAYTGVAGADIDAPEGWAITHGNAAVRIAILDSGVSCVHADLDTKCLEQVNFVTEHGSPVDDLVGHGTHVAGIAAAKTDNNIGTAGVAWEGTIGSLKVCYEDPWFGGLCEDDDIAEAILYAAAAGYHVINMSLAGTLPSMTLENAVNSAWNDGLVLVAGAGNEYGTTKHYPAAYANVIGVAATDYYDNLASFSTFSIDSDDWVSVAAPGHIVFSAVPAELCGLAPDDPLGCYDWKSGTSMATPIVSGIAAMLWAHLSSPTNVLVRQSLENSADTVGALGQNFLSWTQHGRVNLHAALTYQGGGNTPPNASFTFAPASLSVTFTDQSTDTDGNVVSWDWNFGDGNSATAQNPNHAYTTAGTYAVTLTVTDDDGATDATTQNVTVMDTPGNIVLTASGYKVKGLQKADLAWTGVSSSVDVYRDGNVIATTTWNPYTDPIDQRGGGSYIYKVCEAGTSTCSNESTVIF